MLLQAYQSTRKVTEELCHPLAIEDYVVQSIEDVSPPKWHLAHTTWFFETFLLRMHYKKYQPFHPHFQHLFNSYYHTLGNPFPRARRGLLSRPTVESVYTYRKYVDQHVNELLMHASDEQLAEYQSIVTLGIHHEQQHQELLLMDIKHNFSLTPELAIYSEIRTPISQSSVLEWMPMTGGVVDIGNEGQTFCFDNELPRHQQLINPFLLANRLTTNGEYLEFIEAGGYQQSDWWLADGWDCVQKNQWCMPLYWQQQNRDLFLFTLSGLQKINLNEPLIHVSYFEADAYARWRQARLPTEMEWEHFVLEHHVGTDKGNFLETGLLQPRAYGGKQPGQFFGDVWEWTSSAYQPYPGYRPLSGALGEYNGKFMNNQNVLKGGSCATPKDHIRASYRNFYQPEKRWQFSGIRLANSVGGIYRD